ncbi:hypothetical protein BC826DRAFT_269012 [Russula brevipes]|nr:hypothetical protein BC826DRAFT_269012 [Russula brevipes]
MCPPTIRSFDRHAPGYVARRWGPYDTSIHMLDNDALLNIFCLCQPVVLDEDEVDVIRILQGGEWDRERWWYKLAQVCQRWRYLILASPSYLRLCLVCTYGTPVADMLAHSPPLPLVIDYVDRYRKVTTQDEEGVVLALQHRDRVRRIRLRMPIPNLQELVAAMDDEFPVLEYLYIAPDTKHETCLTLPNAFRAPHLLHLVLNVACPIRSPLLTTMAGLVTLSLNNILPSTYFHPTDLLPRLSLMPQLETLGISFHSPVPNRDVERRLSHTPTMAHVTLPNLRWLGFQGVSAYLEAVLSRINTPVLEKLQILFFNQLTYAVPHLLQFMTTTENLRFRSAKFTFHERAVVVTAYPREGDSIYTLMIVVRCRHLDWQVASVAQLFNELRPVFPAVEYLTLNYYGHTLSSEWHNEADGDQWRELLRSFRSVKDLSVDRDIVGELSRSLLLDNGETPLDLLPELNELRLFGRGDPDNAITPFISARQVSGQPVRLVVDSESESEWDSDSDW